MVNLEYSEIKEIQPESLPPASEEALRELRTRSCQSSDKAGFQLQSQQKFLRRILSPDAPTRSLLMVHGTGTGKTCTAIQVAEEYILRPEFQDKKVFVVASAAVQENFRTQIFDMTRVRLDEKAGILESTQCTGRRYLDMLMRIESEPKNWNNPDVRDKLESTAKKIINEFYEFKAYESFGIMITEKIGVTKAETDEAWVHENFDNRLLIIDEAHNIRESKDSTGVKSITQAMEKLVKIANGLVLVLLTATPMFDTYDEIIFYMNLFLWNERKQGENDRVKISDIFNGDATLKDGPAGQRFRDWCSEYVSFLKGENPFTFPFRLPPPQSISTESIKRDFLGKGIGEGEELRYLKLVESTAQGLQRQVLVGQVGDDAEEKRRALLQDTLLVLPGRKSFKDTFRLAGKQYEYTEEPCLTPEALPNVSAKFVTVLKSLAESRGVALVFSNLVEMGALPFAMALEEHGYTPALGQPILANPAYSGQSKGKYIMISSRSSESEISQMLKLIKDSKNREGSQVRVAVLSQIAAEGIDFRYVRQIHILEPWWNMSRIEQVIGRGLRTCSHALLDFEDQNCTVYLHVIRTGDGRECFDEYTYRTKVVPKAMRIARVRKVMAESAMDCPLQKIVNSLPEDWKNLGVQQRRPEGGEPETFRLHGMMAPTFDDDPDIQQCIVPKSVEDKEHVRPLSTYLDVRDEVLSKVGKLMIDKPIWDRKELLAAMRPYTEEVVVYNLQQAISSGFRFKDSFGRASVLESKGDLYALSPIGVVSATMVDRTTQPPPKGRTELPTVEKPEEPTEVAADILETRRTSFKWPADAATRFSEEVLNGYIFDHEFTDGEKRAYLKTRPKGLPFAERLYVPDSDYIVLGHNKFEPAEEPVGEDRTKLNAWNAALLARFIENKDKVFASVNASGKFTISKMSVTGEEVQRKLEKNAKKYEPVTCGTGDNDKTTVLAFLKFVDKNGKGAPGKFKNAGEQCTYAELMAREEHNCMWITPEELSALYDNPEHKKAFTAAFKK